MTFGGVQFTFPLKASRKMSSGDFSDSSMAWWKAEGMPLECAKKISWRERPNAERKKGPARFQTWAGARWKRRKHQPCQRRRLRPDGTAQWNAIVIVQGFAPGVTAMAKKNLEGHQVQQSEDRPLGRL